MPRSNPGFGEFASPDKGSRQEWLRVYLQNSIEHWQPPANVLKQNLTAKLSNAGFAGPAEISQSHFTAHT